MGMAKRPHIAALMALPRVAAGLERAHGHAADRGRHRRRLRRASCRRTSRSRHDIAESSPAPPKSRGAAARARRARSARPPATRATSWPRSAVGRAPGFRARQPRLHRRHAGGPPDAVHDLPTPARPRRLAGLGRDQGRRHRGRHRRGPECRRLDGRRRRHRQRLRPVAGRYAALPRRGLRAHAGRGRDAG